MNIGSMSNNYIIPYSGVSRVTPVNADNTVDTSTKVKPVECQTCKNREYVDGSNEPDVSFKTPGKIAAGESYAKVSAHEREHVANAIQKSSKPGAKLISANVTLKMGSVRNAAERMLQVERRRHRSSIQRVIHTRRTGNRRKPDF